MPDPQALPNFQGAVIPLEKLFDYALNPSHPRGGPKSRVFASALGYTRENWRELVDAILEALPDHPAVERTRAGGREFAVDLLLTGPGGRAMVRTGWMIDEGHDMPRLTTLYVYR
ncbi:DUF6883 domain-containing protein [Sphaerotilus mobilis]|uniref:DUF6883 domain-containing protein n=1 Tax=Sphaerotilus mobilis TaxID=47994 RepID=A0A4V2EVM6_9BURK|nr:DUF6883 domain-containing protein [Sphaerotilus mobilis]RZS53020.1 hypothetical protein EV685_2643 [Sphaerotilus mobilis]